jgi:hypothetical protein
VRHLAERGDFELQSAVARDDHLVAEAGGQQIVGPYRNTRDKMGNGYIQTYQAAFCAQLGWIGTIAHTTDTATYTIGPAYAPGKLSGAIELRMPPPKPDTIQMLAPMSLWIE